MSDNILTTEIADEFLSNEFSVDLSHYTEIETTAAEKIGNYDGKVDLSGLLRLLKFPESPEAALVVEVQIGIVIPQTLDAPVGRGVEVEAVVLTVEEGSSWGEEVGVEVRGRVPAELDGQAEVLRSRGEADSAHPDLGLVSERRGWRAHDLERAARRHRQRAAGIPLVPRPDGPAGPGPRRSHARRRHDRRIACITIHAYGGDHSFHRR